MSVVEEPLIVKADGKPAMVVARCHRRMNDAEMGSLRQVMERACSVSPDLKGLPVVCLPADIKIEIVALPPAEPSEDARTLTPHEFKLLGRLLTRVAYTIVSLPDDESVLAEEIMQSIEARSSHGFERLT